MQTFGHGWNGQAAHMHEPPYDRDEAETLRKTGRQIVACFQCLIEDKAHPYWPLVATQFAGAQIFCRKHFDAVSLGRAIIKIGDWNGP